MSRKQTSPIPETDSRTDRIRKLYDRRLQQMAYIHEELDADMKCLSMDGPWPENERKARQSPGNERPCLHEDVITQFNNMTTNQLEMNPMGIDVQPEGDGADEKSAEWVEGRIRQVEYEQNGQQAYLTAGKCAVECSIGTWELETDWKNPFTWEKQVCIRAIQDPKSVLFNLNCRKPDWSDMSDAFKISRMSHDEFRQKFPEAQTRDFEGFIGKKGYSDWVDSKEVQVAVFWEVTKKPGSLLLLDDGTDEGWSVFEFEKHLYDVRDGTGATVEQGNALPFLKRKGGAVVIVGNGLEEVGYGEGREFAVIKESKRFVPKVTKCLTNGIEILEETDWDDCEIPIFIVTGRVKFENGKKVIDSQTRKARTGQLLYDLCISSIQEETARIPKNLYMGYEGQFDTNTNWAKIHREPTGYAEAKATTEEVGSEKPLPLPELVHREPQISQLLELKVSLLLSIQNAIGMSSTERKDRASKSGKALEQLQEDMNVGTYHYHNSLRMAQLRQYRQINRLLPKIENTAREVGTRDVKGNYKTHQITADHYQNLGRHQPVIGSAKYYQSLQEEQSDFAEALLGNIKDATIMLAVLPDLIRMKGLGPYGDDLAKMVEAMQPPQMQQARQEGQQQVSPAMMQQMTQQAQQTVAALNAHAKELEGKIAELLFEKKAETLKLSQQRELEEMKLKVEVDKAVIAASVKENIADLDAQVQSVKHIADMLVSKFQLDHQSEQGDLDRQHAHDLAAQNADAARQQQESQQAADAAQTVGAAQ